jgi:hypothetical protein
MIYLLAILWFASGFFGAVYCWTANRLDFKFPSAEFFMAVLAGAIAPSGWLLFLLALIETRKLPQITLFKARNK